MVIISCTHTHTNTHIHFIYTYIRIHHKFDTIHFCAELKLSQQKKKCKIHNCTLCHLSDVSLAVALRNKRSYTLDRLFSFFFFFSLSGFLKHIEIYFYISTFHISIYSYYYIFSVFLYSYASSIFFSSDPKLCVYSLHSTESFKWANRRFNFNANSTESIFFGFVHFQFVGYLLVFLCTYTYMLNSQCTFQICKMLLCRFVFIQLF